MALPFDFLVLDDCHRCRLAVETKARQDTDDRWATELRQFLLEHSHGLQSDMLIATPAICYFWCAAAPPDAPPSRLPAEPIFAAYLPRAGLRAETGIDRGLLLDVVHWWLQDLTTAVNLGPALPELEVIHRAVRGGRVVYIDPVCT